MEETKLESQYQGVGFGRVDLESQNQEVGIGRVDLKYQERVDI